MTGEARARLGAALLALLAAWPARAEWQRLELGDCELAADPVTPEGASQAAFVVCLKGDVGAETTTVSGTPEANQWTRYGSLYAGIHASQWVSLHARGYVRDILRLGDEVEENLDRSLDYAALQIGNPALHRVWVDVGRLRLPFGIDLSEAPEAYRALESRRFWSSPPQGVSLSLDDQKAFRIDLGYGSDEFVKAAREKNAEREGLRVTGPLPPDVHAASVRVSYDIAALDGTRLTASGYGENRGKRRYGLGVLTIGRRGDMTQFEFVRLLATPGGEVPFEQLLRGAYVGTWRNDTRWVVQYDDERFRMRMGVVAHDMRLWGHLIFRLAVGHNKSEVPGDKTRRWLLTSGLEAQL